MIRIAAAVVAIALLGSALWYLTRDEPLAVTVQEVAPGRVEDTVANTRAGTVMACRRARLSPQGGGQVAELDVAEGDAVEAGQVLLQLWNEDLKAQRRLAERQAAASGARAEEACLKAAMAEREARRLRPLKERGLVSTERLDQAETDSRATAAACRAAEAAVGVDEARIDVARAAVERSLLRAPFAGVVAEVTAELGEYVTPSPPGIPTPPAVDLIDYGCIYISAPIDEVDAPGIRTGMPVRVTLDAFPGRAFPAEVRRIAPYVLDVERQARTVEVEVVLEDAAATEFLLPGYSADIEVILEARAEALRIPTEAVLEGDRVWVLEAGGTLARREVRTGIRNWRYTEVTGGLAAGDRVLTAVDLEGLEAGAAAVAQP